MEHFQNRFGVEKVGTGAAVVFSLYVVYVVPFFFFFFFRLACKGPFFLWAPTALSSSFKTQVVR